MIDIRYVTRLGSKPSGKLQIFVSGPLRGAYIYQEKVDRLLLKHGNYAVWHYFNTPDADGGRDLQFSDPEKVYERLVQCRLLVLILTKENSREDVDRQLMELAVAKQQKIAVLPILMDDADINTFPGEIRKLEILFLESAEADSGEKEKKAEDFLSSVLIGKNEEDKIRAGFRGRAFLSYRKKDRETAMALMHMIHDVPELYDCGIWYDEYLTPGEEYNEEIRQRIRSSDIFLMNITPGMVERPGGVPNYVSKYEYPEAKRSGLFVLPVEMRPTDAAALEKSFPGIGIAFSPSDTSLQELLRNLDFERDIRSGPDHYYHMGLAYLLGIEAEKRPQRALELLERAAGYSYGPAFVRLMDCYRYGNGVDQSYDRMFEWAYRYADCLRQDFNKLLMKMYSREEMEELFTDQIDEPASAYFLETFARGQLAMDIGRAEDAISFFSMAQNGAEEIFRWIDRTFEGRYSYLSNALLKMVHWMQMNAMACTGLGDAIGAKKTKENYPGAMEWHQKAMDLLEDILVKILPEDIVNNPVHIRLFALRAYIVQDYRITCQHAGDTANSFGDYELAGHLFEKARLAGEGFGGDSLRKRINQIIDRSKDADRERNKYQFLKALEIYQECLNMCDDLLEETGEMEAERGQKLVSCEGRKQGYSPGAALGGFSVCPFRTAKDSTLYTL